jgi:hypothetical protein
MRRFLCPATARSGSDRHEDLLMIGIPSLLAALLLAAPWLALDDPRTTDPPPAAPLVIALDGRAPVTLMLAGRRLEGHVRGARVDVQVGRAELTGSIAGEPVWIWMHGDEAEGHIGGHAVGFTLTHTEAGDLLQGTSVRHTVRLERWLGLLSWLPGCEEWLLPLPRDAEPRTVYQATCATGRRLRLSLPDALDELPPLPRLILLALLLTEPDPIVATRLPGLFPEKEGAR